MARPADPGRAGGVLVSRILTFDVGKTSCRACLFVDGVRTATARCSGARGIADVGGATAALARMAEAAQDIGVDRVDAVSSGLAGLGAAEDAAPMIAETLARRHHTTRVALTTDMTAAHVGALAGADGVVVAVGTGAVAMGVAGDGSCSTVDGWGFLLGDAGSGYAIGQAGLAGALRAYDGRGGSADLAARAEQRFGPLAGLPAIVHGSENPASEVAAFATEVCAAAADGDPFAAGICTRAGRELVRTTVTAAARSGQNRENYQLAVTGGIFDTDTAVWRAFHGQITSGAPAPRVNVRQGDGCDGARLIAIHDDLPHEQLISRPEVTV